MRKVNKPNYKKQKIKWRCRRGMRELDLWLNFFVDRHLDILQAAEIEALEELLEQDDGQLELWLLKGQLPYKANLKNICKKIRLNAALST